MTQIESGRGGRSRRSFLGALGAGTVVVAGCLGNEVEETDHDVPVRGDPDADVTLEVYEDFTCPACREFNGGVFPDIASAYLDAGSIRYEHREFPFRNDEAWQAANAAREVYLEDGEEQFWEYKSELFANQDRLESGAPDVFGEIATTLELDGDRIESAAVDRSHDSILEDDKSRGEGLSVSVTPGFVLDEELVEIEDSWNELFDAIDDAV